MSSPTELARDALSVVGSLRTKSDYFRQETERLDLNGLRERVRLLKAQVGRLERRSEEAGNVQRLIAVLEDRVAELKRAREEEDKRHRRSVDILRGPPLQSSAG